jgi:branched-chain amino acid transport system substrate-binding protein
LLAACGNGGSGSSSGGVYNVIFISDLSGPFAPVAAPGAAGAEAAFDNINATGGINGKKIHVQVIDSQSTASGALAAAQKAVSEKPLAILMSSGSAGAAAITSLMQSAKVPFITGDLNDSSVYPAEPYLYQPSLTAKQDAEAMTEFVKQKLHGSVSGKTIDVAAINSPYVETLITDARKILTAEGAKMGATESYNLPLASFATQAETISLDKPAAVLVLGSTDDSVVVSKALTAAGVNALQVGIPSGAAQATIQETDSANYYALTPDPYPNQLPKFLSIAAKYGKKTQVSESIFSMADWVAAYAVADALQHCGTSCTAAGLNSALEHISNYTVPDDVSYGTVTFSATSHAAVDVVRFHSYDPATHQWTESGPITVP